MSRPNTLQEVQAVLATYGPGLTAAQKAAATVGAGGSGRAGYKGHGDTAQGQDFMRLSGGAPRRGGRLERSGERDAPPIPPGDPGALLAGARARARDLRPGAARAGHSPGPTPYRSPPPPPSPPTYRRPRARPPRAPLPHLRAAQALARAEAEAYASGRKRKCFLIMPAQDAAAKAGKGRVVFREPVQKHHICIERDGARTKGLSRPGGAQVGARAHGGAPARRRGLGGGDLGGVSAIVSAACGGATAASSRARSRSRRVRVALWHAWRCIHDRGRPDLPLT